MSADDTWIVTEVKDNNSKKPLYAVFHTMGEDDRPATKEHAVGGHTFTAATTAILYGHWLQMQSPAEYGVWVHPRLLDTPTIWGRISGYVRRDDARHSSS